MANTKSLDFEFSSSQYAYITDANQTGLDITGDMTIEAWVRFESLPSPATSNNRIIVSKYETQKSFIFSYANGDGAGAYAWWFASSGDGSSTNIQALADTSISVDTWYHIAVVYDASEGTADFYKNGSYLGQVTSLDTSLYNSNAALVIGASGATKANFFDGLIDEVRIWNDVRTSTEISNNYQTELVGNESGLVAYYRFEDNANDTTSNDNDLTLSGSPSYSSTVPFAGSTTTSTSSTSTSTSTSSSTSSTSTTTSTSSSTSSSTSTTTTSTSSSTTTTIDPNLGGLAFGEETPDAPEIAISWQTWGGDGSVSGDVDWGKYQIDVGETAYSQVYDFGNDTERTLTLTENKYGSGSGDATLRIRGSATYFEPNAGTPSWNNYSSPTNQTWRYVQVSVTK